MSTGDDGRLSAGQSFTPALAPDGTQLLLGPVYPGDIFDGRLRIHTDSLVLSIDTGDIQLDLTIRDAELRFDIDENGLTNGMIGGGLPVADIVAAADLTMPGAGELVQPIAQNAADVVPSADDPLVCTTVSLGIEFDATTADLQR